MKIYFSAFAFRVGRKVEVGLGRLGSLIGFYFTVGFSCLLFRFFLDGLFLWKYFVVSGKRFMVY